MPTDAEQQRIAADGVTKASVLYSDKVTNAMMRDLCERAESFSIRQYWDGADWRVDYEIAALKAGATSHAN